MTHGTPRQTGRKRQTERQADETERKTGRDDTWDTQAGRDRQADRQTDRWDRKGREAEMTHWTHWQRGKKRQAGWQTGRQEDRGRRTLTPTSGSEKSAPSFLSPSYSAGIKLKWQADQHYQIQPCTPEQNQHYKTHYHMLWHIHFTALSGK